MIITEKSHFNELQMKVRAIASTWILAGFGAIAYFIKSSAPVLIFFSSYTMINLMCLMVVVGLLILWVLDQIVYQRLFNASFVAGLYEEFINPKVPPIRFLMIVGSEYKGMARWYNTFYFLPMAVFTVFSSASLVLELVGQSANQKTNVVSIIIGITLIIIVITIWYYIFNKKRQTPFINLLDSFGKTEFKEACTSKEGCKKFIKRWKAEQQSELGDQST